MSCGGVEHPNAERARRGFAAFAAGDRETLEELIDENATWRIPGRSALAGVYRGLGSILGMLRETAVRTGGTYRAELKYVVASDDHVVAVYRASGARDGRTIDIEQALLMRTENGRWVEIDALPTDQYAFDEFWSD